MNLKSEVLQAAQLVHKSTTERAATQAVFGQTGCLLTNSCRKQAAHDRAICTHVCKQPVHLGCRPSSTQQWSFRLTCVLHVGPVVALPNAPPVDDHSTQPHLSNIGLVSVVTVQGMVWAVLGQEALQVQLLAILDLAVQLDWLCVDCVCVEMLQHEDEGVGDGVDAEFFVGHLLPAATMERHVAEIVSSACLAYEQRGREGLKQQQLVDGWCCCTSNLCNSNASDP